MRIDVRGDTAAVLRDLQFDVPKITRAAQTTALNKTIRKIRTQFTRALGRRTGIAQKHIRRTLREYRATYRNLRARVWFGLKAKVPLDDALGKRKSVPAKLEGLLDFPAGKSAADMFSADLGRGERLYVRRGRDRFPLTRPKVNLSTVADSVMRAAGDAVGPTVYRDELIYDIRRRLRSSARRRTRGSRRR